MWVWYFMDKRFVGFFLYLGGVSGTPLYAINGVVKVIDKAWSLTDWSVVLDPFMRKSVGLVIFIKNHLTFWLIKIEIKYKSC